MSEPIITVESLSKCYRIGTREKGYKTFREAIIDGFTAPIRNFRRLRKLTKFGEHNPMPPTQRSMPTSNDVIWALKDVSFEVKKGEVLGVIGRNGAGKSTLLKILSRITEPTSGDVRLYGRVSSLLEVGTGFHPELTGRENIYLNGAILGMRKAEIDRKFDEIIDFAEIEKFIDTPVKRYSSGMYVRLAFAVAAHLEPEILLVDEVLAVGDAAFQKKCLGKMGDISKGGRTVLFVSHNMGAIRLLCQRTLLIEQGRMSFDGEAVAAIDKYLNYTPSREAVVSSDELQKRVSEWNPNCEMYFQCEEIALLDQAGQPHTEFKSNEEIMISIKCRCLKYVPKLNIVVEITNEDNDTIVRSESLDEVSQEESYAFQPGKYQSKCILPSNLFGEKHFFVTVGLIFHGVQHLVFRKILSFDVRFQGYSYSNYSIHSRTGGYIRPKLDWRTRVIA